jgi:hypothetical protein
MKPGALVSVFFPFGTAHATGGGCAIAFSTARNRGQRASYPYVEYERS